MPIWLIIVLVIIVLLVIYVVATYNKLVDLRNRVRDQWSQIDVQLKRRFDLIPNLVSTVKGYAKHESETLESVIAARNSYTTAATPHDKMEANNMLTDTLNKLFALAESYPDLKANTNFLELQQELSDTETKIQAARQFYNTMVMSLNSKIEMFPSNIVANLFHFKSENYFELDEQEKVLAKNAPTVQF